MQLILQKDRLSILKMICVSTEMDADVDLNVIAQVTDGFTGADLQAVLYTAHMHCEKVSNHADPRLRRIGFFFDFLS